MKKLIWLAPLLLCWGCTKTNVNVWQAQADSPADVAFTRPGVDFSNYKDLMALPMEIYFSICSGEDHSTEIERIRSIFRAKFGEVLAGDYELATAPSPQTLKVRASLIDLRVTDQCGTSASVPRGLREYVDAGHMTLLMEIIDSESDEVLARAADEDKSAAMPMGIPGDQDWRVVEIEVARWAGMFRSFLDNSL